MGDNVTPYLEPVVPSCWLPVVHARSLQRLSRAIGRSVPIEDMFIDEDGLLSWEGRRGNVVQKQASLLVGLVLARIGEEGGETEDVSLDVIARQGNRRLSEAWLQGIRPEEMTIGRDLLPVWPSFGLVVLPPIPTPPPVLRWLDRLVHYRLLLVEIFREMPETLWCLWLLSSNLAA
ncbi:unnamed protein product [Clonostachys chloroleuca]|uniref:Uncharacterized protein n=1 Tax=Clonostachys chloroleuca TaxID=1926264 RepID=A0AA35Q106_9HYPO|nr:unnamed protein product [Clonostachys chloroleuca]